jgi:hypothetical protein
MMREPSPTGTPQLPDILSMVFDDANALDALINGTEKSEEIIGKLVCDTGHDLEKQNALLRGLIQVMAHFEVTNQRSAALRIINSQLLGAMITDHSDEISKSYSDAIGQQVPEGTLFSDGPIDILLNAGISIAPRLAWNTKQWKDIHAAWDALADRFPHINQRFHIRTRYQKMYDRRSPDPRRDARIEAYRTQGLGVPAIAKKERVSSDTIKRILTRLIALGRCKKLNARTDAEQREYDELKPQVEHYRNAGLGNKEIAEKLGKDRRLIDQIASDLVRERKITTIVPAKDTRGDTNE